MSRENTVIAAWLIKDEVCVGNFRISLCKIDNA